ncbi:EAL domain-containing protein [Pseudomonas putida]|uniref:putative bifunctional diguanylate cyclase/phosphodiesterase n=1 Tax=Pseudomonas putida TaxID=303 RepID=UPI0018AB3ECA|nr:EAL domain-containing protein [Pseudomonas putida]MBF8670252.1 EAL domain-containing protein [Pseudomonas putida]MBF8713126.1 EAL domain-containing protein [Pseudomonas putida]
MINVQSNIDLSMFEALTEASMHTIVIIDGRGTIQAVSRTVQKDFGYTQEELIGNNVSCLMPPEYAAAHDGYLRNYFKTGSRKIIGTGRELLGQHKSGSQFPMYLNISEFQLEGRSGFIGICYDISEHHKQSERIFQLVAYDTLTGCFNRHQLIKTLDDRLIECKNQQEALAVLYIDLDGFKQINDNYSHTVGDKVLIQVVERFRTQLQPHDSLGRIGGDEFIALVTAPDSRALQEVCSSLLQCLNAPFVINEIPLRVSASIGISLYPQHGETSDALVSAADIAMYQAKSDGDIKRTCIFNQQMRDASEHVFYLSTRLRTAIQQNQFELHYQLQFDLRRRSPSGLEALIRWRGNDGKYIPPNDFLPIAQTYGLMPELTRWVLRRACLDNSRLIEEGILDVPVAVNISTSSFCSYDFVQTVMDLCTETQLPTNRLEIEVIEDVAMHNLEVVTGHAQALNQAGISLSMDDFGTGYSSLSRLRNLQFHKLKIDQSFAKNLSKNASDQAIVCAILGISKALGMQVVAEGIETQEQLEWFRDNGCEQGQGFWLARPLPLDELTAWMRSQTWYITGQ